MAGEQQTGKVMKIWNDLPPMAKGVVAIVTIGVTGLLVLKAVKFIKREAKAKADRQAAAAQAKDISALEKEGIKSQLTDADLKVIAAQIFNAADGVGTDEDTIFLALGRINNDTEMKKLIQIYGVKTNCALWNCAKQNLISTLTSELDSSDIQKLNKKFSIKGMNFRI